MLNLGDLSDELSAKVAQMQALLAEETSNMGNQLTQLDKDVLQRLEESYASSDSEDEDDDGKRVARHAKKASATATVTKKMKVMKKPRKDDDNFSSDTAPVTGITTGDGPPKRGRPKGSLNKAKSGALNASVATNTTTRAREHRPDVANVPGSVPGSTVGTVLPQTTRAGNVVRRGPRGKSGGKATDSMKTYLKDIGTVSLLNSAQEVELAKRIQDLVYLDGVRETVTDELGKDPSVFEWACAANVTVGELETRLEEGKRAKNLMIQANLRLVVSIAKRYANKSMSFQDLIQEGCVGLIRGAEKFDFKRGYKFSTYAHWWIRQAITRCIADQSRTIRLPVHLFEMLSRLKKTTKALEKELGRDPSESEVAEAMGMTEEKIAMVYKASQVPLSTEVLMGGTGGNDDEQRKLEDTLEDETAVNPEDTSVRVLLRDDMENVLNTLSPRERDVLRLRYGLDDGKVKTLEEIGNVFHVTRERIRQIEAKALRKLRQPSRNLVLTDYMAKGVKPGVQPGAPGAGAMAAWSM